MHVHTAVFVAQKDVGQLLLWEFLSIDRFEKR